MNNPCTVYYADKDTYLDKLMPEIPVNAFINKGRCGIGGTTLELKNGSRKTIITVPTVGILLCKKIAYPALLIVYEKTSVEEIRSKLLKASNGFKIMTTPEGFGKIIKAADALGMLEQIYNDWFLLLDECHSYITDDFRSDILKPFKHFWNFKHKSVISATPYYYSDPSFQQLAQHKVIINEKLGEVNLINCNQPMGALNKLLEQKDTAKDNIYVFLNSVTAIADAIRRSQLVDNISIFCADDREKENMEKLGDLSKFYKASLEQSNLSKVNFLTSKYFEGCDIYNSDATVVLVTDVHQPHTMVSVSLKLKQAIGRLRFQPAAIYHLTNSFNIQVGRQSLNAFETKCMSEANRILKHHAEYITECAADDAIPNVDPRVEKYADVGPKHEAVINFMKLDQHINAAYENEAYHSISTLIKQWEELGYTVKVQRSIDTITTKTKHTRMSKKDKLKRDFLKLIDIQAQHKGDTVFNFGAGIEQDIKANNPLAYQAAKCLTRETMERLDYKCKDVERELILISNQKQEVKLLQLLEKTFVLGSSYSLSSIKSTLQSYYNKLDIRDEHTGKFRTAKATHLEHYGWFKVAEDKLRGTNTHALKIVSVSFSVRLAA